MMTNWTSTRRGILATLGLMPFAAKCSAIGQETAYSRYSVTWTKLAAGEPVGRNAVQDLLADPEELGDAPVNLGSFSAARPSLDVLYGAIASHIASVLDPNAANLPPLEDRGQVFAWSWSFTGRAAILLCQASGQQRFRDVFVNAARRIMALRDDLTCRVEEVQERAVRSWGAPWPVHGETKRVTDVTVTGLVSLPIVTFANDIGRSDPLWDEFAGYGRDLAKSLFEFDRYFTVLPGTQDGYYRSWLDPATFEAQNHVHALAAAGAEIYRITGNKAILERLQLIWNGFQRITEIGDNGGARWPYIPNQRVKNKILPEAFWKAGVTLEFPLACHRAGILVTETNMASYARLYSENVLLTDDTYNQLIGLKEPALTYRWDAPLSSPEIESLMPFIFRGLWFSAYEPSLRPRLNALLRRYPTKFPNGLLSSPFGLMARAYWEATHKKMPGARPG